MSLSIERTDTPDSVSESFVDIEEEARVKLQHSPYRALRRVSCEFLDGTLYLHGRVPTYHYKQLAQVAVVGLDGVHRIVNEVEVDPAF